MIYELEELEKKIKEKEYWFNRLLADHQRALNEWAHESEKSLRNECNRLEHELKDLKERRRMLLQSYTTPVKNTIISVEPPVKKTTVNVKPTTENITVTPWHIKKAELDDNLKKIKEQSKVKEEILKPEISVQKECSCSETTEECNDSNYPRISKMPYRAMMKESIWKQIEQLAQVQCKLFQKSVNAPGFYRFKSLGEMQKELIKSNIKILFERIEVCEKSMLIILDKSTTIKELEENMLKSKIKELFEENEELQKISLKSFDELMTLEEREKLILRQLDEFTALEEFHKNFFKTEMIKLFEDRKELEKVILRCMRYDPLEYLEKIILEGLDEFSTLVEYEKELLRSKIKGQREKNEDLVKYIVSIFVKKTSIEDFEKIILKSMIEEQLQKNEDHVKDILTSLDMIITKEEFEKKKAAEAKAEAEKAATQRAEAQKAEALKAAEAQRAAAKRTEAAYMSYRSNDPCYGCRCKESAQAYLLPMVPLEVNLNCEHIRMTRNVKADWYWCYKGGPPRDGSPGGWYPGRGY